MTATDAVDVLVVGGGPAGRAAALEAAVLGGSVALAERRALDDHLFADGGAVATRILRIAVDGLIARGRRAGVEPLRVDDLMWPARRLLASEVEHNLTELVDAGVEVVRGTARFAGDHEIEIATPAGLRTLRAGRVIVAVGTRAHHPPGVAFDGRTVIEPHELLHLGVLPSTAVVVGGGLIGFEYASVLSALGAYVVLLERGPMVLPFVDRDLAGALVEAVEEGGVEVRVGCRVSAVGPAGDGRVATLLEGGDAITSHAVLWAADRHGATDDLRLGLAGLAPDDQGLLTVGDGFRTAVGHIHAVGEVVGYPCLASDAAEQGRVAARAACGAEALPPRRRAPLVLWSIPALASSGLTEEELKDESRPYVIGRCSFSELVRGRLGADRGWLKLLAEPGGRLLGVHVLGQGAPELVHLGEAVMAAGGTLGSLLDAGYAYGCDAGAYRLAALDALRQGAVI
jgi:NAD(P) transhydrogenase